MIGALFSVFGLAIGSFLNVAILRYGGESFFSVGRLGGRSSCPRCKRQLRWYELVPVLSFAVQGGKCRGCRSRISWQYPAVELATAGAFFLASSVLYSHYSFPDLHPYRIPMVVGWAAIFASLIALSAVDIRMMLIPDELTILIAAVGLAFGFADSGFFGSTPYFDSFLGNYSFLFPQFGNPFISHIIGGVAGFALLGAIALVSRGRAMGMGDVKLAGAMGLVLGFPDIYFALALGFLLGGAWSAVLVVSSLFRGGRTGMGTMVPFGPFLALGFLAHVLFIHPLVTWYFALL